ncbi:MAG: hypothetical protein Q8L27_04050 [archaeon]|nr:hypothetical protein [archaeon]
MRDLTPQEEARIARDNVEYQKLEAQRVEALNSRDASKYSKLCDLLGVEPELPELVERARADEVYASRKPVKKSSKPRKNAANPIKYAAFLMAAETCDYDNFSADSDDKREILKGHFPMRYDKQRMFSYTDHKLGVVFKKIIDSALDVVRRDY